MVKQAQMMLTSQKIEGGCHCDDDRGAFFTREKRACYHEIGCLKVHFLLAAKRLLYRGERSTQKRLWHKRAEKRFCPFTRRIDEEEKKWLADMVAGDSCSIQ